MAEIYEQFDAAFRHISAHGLILHGEIVGRVCIKWGNACTAYVQIWGAPMEKGRAGGGGYDRATAAIEQAARKMKPESIDAARKLEREAMLRLCNAFGADARDGARWTSRLEDAGFKIANVIA